MISEARKKIQAKLRSKYGYHTKKSYNNSNTLRKSEEKFETLQKNEITVNVFRSFVSDEIKVCLLMSSAHKEVSEYGKVYYHTDHVNMMYLDPEELNLINSAVQECVKEMESDKK